MGLRKLLSGEAHSEHVHGLEFSLCHHVALTMYALGMLWCSLNTASCSLSYYDLGFELYSDVLKGYP